MVVFLLINRLIVAALRAGDQDALHGAAVGVHQNRALLLKSKHSDGGSCCRSRLLKEPYTSWCEHSVSDVFNYLCSHQFVSHWTESCRSVTVHTAVITAFRTAAPDCEPASAALTVLSHLNADEPQKCEVVCSAAGLETSRSRKAFPRGETQRFVSTSEPIVEEPGD